MLVRPMLALAALSPRLGERITHLVGVTEMDRQATAGPAPDAAAGRD